MEAILVFALVGVAMAVMVGAGRAPGGSTRAGSAA
jgi:hypothetical protein